MAVAAELGDASAPAARRKLGRFCADAGETAVAAAAAAGVLDTARRWCGDARSVVAAAVEGEAARFAASNARAAAGDAEGGLKSRLLLLLLLLLASEVIDGDAGGGVPPKLVPRVKEPRREEAVEGGEA